MNENYRTSHDTTSFPTSRWKPVRKENYLLVSESNLSTPSWQVDDTSSSKSSAEGQPSLKRLKANINILKSFLNLEENWNYAGAGPFSKNLVNKVIAIIQSLEFQPQIFPTGRDSIQLEYEKEDGSYLEFEIFEGKIQCLWQEGESEKEFEIRSPQKIEDLTRIFHA